MLEARRAQAQVDQSQPAEAIDLSLEDDHTETSASVFIQTKKDDEMKPSMVAKFATSGTNLIQPLNYNFSYNRMVDTDKMRGCIEEIFYHFPGRK